MTLVDRQRGLTDPLPPDVEVLFREARQRRQRRRRVGLVLFLCAALIITALALVTAGGNTFKSGVGHRPPARSYLPVGTPSEIVGWTSRFQLVVLATRTGAVLRTLASNISLAAPGLPAISVTPGGEVYFDSTPISGVSPPGAQGDQIFRVPLAGGPLVEIGPGYDPQVSPSGEFLAYVASNGVGEAPYLDANGGIVIASLMSGAVSRVQTLHPSDGQLNQGVSDLSWSPDSHRLSFELFDSSTQTTTSWTIASTSAGGTMASAEQIPLQRAGLAWLGYLKTSTTGAPLGVGVLTAAARYPSLTDAQTIVAINPTSGNIVDRYFSLPAAICTPYPPPANCVSEFSNPVSVDSIGSSLLVAGAIPTVVGGWLTTSGKSYLYRWSTGSSKPVKLKEGVLSATWGPAS